MLLLLLLPLPLLLLLLLLLLMVWRHTNRPHLDARVRKADESREMTSLDSRLIGSRASALRDSDAVWSSIFCAHAELVEHAAPHTSVQTSSTERTSGSSRCDFFSCPPAPVTVPRRTSKERGSRTPVSGDPGTGPAVTEIN
jgi:hypothetical protein